MLSENYDHRRERSGALGFVEVEPTPHETDFTSLSVDVVVEIAGIGPGWQQGDDGRLGLLGLLAAFLYPGRYRFSVWGVNKYSVAGPVLRQAVILLRVMPLTLCVFVRGAGVQVKMELSVESLERGGGRCPFVRPAGEHSCGQKWFFLHCILRIKQLRFWCFPARP